jgi:signal transduction histidine kinase
MEQQSDPDSDARSEVRDVLDILSRPDDEELLEIVRLAADLCAAESAGLTILKDGEYHIRLTHGMEPLVCPADESFCQFTMTTEGAYFVEDALADERFADLGWVTGQFGFARFYASAPVYCPNGTMLGRLCVISRQPQRLTALQERALEALANSVTRILELRLKQRSRPGPMGQDIAVMSHLAAELSHDMRVPLSSILASVEMLQDELADTADPAVRMLLARAGAAADRMSRMLEQIMHFGSIDDHPELHDVDLGKLVSRLVLDSGGVLDARGARVEVSDLPVVRADSDEMYSLFQNLITNSAKFARPGVPARIRISARRTGDFWRVSVVDNGIGIPEDRRADVFALFSRLDPAVDGHGIGLATAARIVTAHGGRIAAEDAPGGGTEIWFELPALPDDRADT